MGVQALFIGCRQDGSGQLTTKTPATRPGVSTNCNSNVPAGSAASAWLDHIICRLLKRSSLLTRLCMVRDNAPILRGVRIFVAAFGGQVEEILGGVHQSQFPRA